MKIHKMKVHKMELNKALYRSVTFKIAKKRCMFAVSWALEKGDWWYENKTDRKKFLSFSKEDRNDKMQYGMYIARLGIAIMAEK